MAQALDQVQCSEVQFSSVQSSQPATITLFSNRNPFIIVLFCILNLHGGQEEKRILAEKIAFLMQKRTVEVTYAAKQRQPSETAKQKKRVQQEYYGLDLLKMRDWAAGLRKESMKQVCECILCANLLGFPLDASSDPRLLLPRTPLPRGILRRM